MTRWIDNSIADRLYILDHISSLKDITPESVEKDWWVTAVLQCVFELTAAPYMYFKGGTSLSKGWRLIDRFSEDIDIALYRDFFLNELHKGCAVCETNNQIMNLRKVSVFPYAIKSACRYRSGLGFLPCFFYQFLAQPPLIACTE